MLYCVPNLTHNIIYAKCGKVINTHFLITKIPLYVYFKLNNECINETLHWNIKKNNDCINGKCLLL